MTFLDKYMAPDLMHNLTPQAIRGYNHLNTLLFRVDVRDVTEAKVIAALRGEAVEFNRNDVKDADIRVFIQEAIAIRGVLPPEEKSDEKPAETPNKALSTEAALTEADRLHQAVHVSLNPVNDETSEEKDEGDSDS